MTLLNSRLTTRRSSASSNCMLPGLREPPKKTLSSDRPSGARCWNLVEDHVTAFRASSRSAGPGLQSRRAAQGMHLVCRRGIWCPCLRTGSCRAWRQRQGRRGEQPGRIVRRGGEYHLPASHPDHLAADLEHVSPSVARDGGLDPRLSSEPGSQRARQPGDDLLRTIDEEANIEPGRPSGSSMLAHGVCLPPARFRFRAFRACASFPPTSRG